MSLLSSHRRVEGAGGRHYRPRSVQVVPSPLGSSREFVRALDVREQLHRVECADDPRACAEESACVGEHAQAGSHRSFAIHLPTRVRRATDCISAPGAAVPQSTTLRSPNRHPVHASKSTLRATTQLWYSASCTIHAGSPSTPDQFTSHRRYIEIGSFACSQCSRSSALSSKGSPQKRSSRTSPPSETTPCRPRRTRSCR